MKGIWVASMLLVAAVGVGVWVVPYFSASERTSIVSSVTPHTPPSTQESLTPHHPATATPARPIVAKVIWTKGTFWAIDPKKFQRELKKGAAVFLHDTLKTDPQSQAQIVFTDNTLMTFRQTTEFYIKEYAYAPGEGSQTVGTYIVDLITGGFRTITGLIAKANPAEYQVNTPVATIGIRGTDYTVYLTKSEGLYLKYDHGQPCVTNPGGTMCLDKNQPFAHVTDINTKPVSTDQLPQAFTSEPLEVVPTDYTPPEPGMDTDPAASATEEGQDTSTESNATDTSSEEATTESDTGGSSDSGSDSTSESGETSSDSGDASSSEAGTDTSTEGSSDAASESSGEATTDAAETDDTTGTTSGDSTSGTGTGTSTESSGSGTSISGEGSGGSSQVVESGTTIAPSSSTSGSSTGATGSSSSGGSSGGFCIQ